MMSSAGDYTVTIHPRIEAPITVSPIHAYSKAIAAILAAVLAVLVAPLSDGHLSTVELVNVLIAGATAVVVYLVPNLPTGAGRYLKLVMAALGAALQVVATVLASAGVVSLSDWLTVVLAALGALGVYVVPNATIDTGTHVDGEPASITGLR